MDLINRNEAIEAVDGKLGEFNANNKAVSILMHLPSVEPVRHGRWINDRWEDDVNYHTCNACCVEIRVTYFDNYCPNCGARMDGEQDG